MKRSGIGGQAVLEGVMMKNKNQYAVAVRKPNGEIVVDKQEYHSVSEKYKILKLPLLRGVVAFVETLSLGIKTLSFSSGLYEEEEKKRQEEIEKKGADKGKGKGEAVAMGFTIVFALLLAIGIFMVLPWFASQKLANIITEPWKQALAEGGMRLGIFLVYVFAISLIKDVRRIYKYHGAEHKVINCVENGLDLTVENVGKQSKEHRSCAASFIFDVLMISILCFMFIRVDDAALRILYRILLVPVVAAIVYEFVYFTGKYDNLLTKLLSRPGMWMQALIIREPEENMIETAIASVDAVFDWKVYIEQVQQEAKSRKTKNKKDKKSKHTSDFKVVDFKEENTSQQPSKDTASLETPKIVPLKRADSRIRRDGYFRDLSKDVREETRANTAMEEITESKEGQGTEEAHNETVQSRVAAVKRAEGVRRPMQPMEEFRRDTDLAEREEDEEDDEILSALDKFFE